MRFKIISYTIKKFLKGFRRLEIIAVPYDQIKCYNVLIITLAQGLRISKGAMAPLLFEELLLGIYPNCHSKCT